MTGPEDTDAEGHKSRCRLRMQTIHVQYTINIGTDPCPAQAPLDQQKQQVLKKREKADDDSHSKCSRPSNFPPNYSYL